MKHTSPPHRAFTLIETLIVLSILAAIAALVLPGAVDELRAVRTSQTVQDIALAADACRSQAIRTGQPWRLILVPAGTGQRLAMEPVIPNQDPQAPDSTSIPSPPADQAGDRPAQPREELLELPDSVALSMLASEAEADRPETDREAQPAQASEANLLAVYLPDGSAISRGFELTSRGRRFRFAATPGSGKLVSQPVLESAVMDDRPSDLAAAPAPAKSSASEEATR